MLPAGSRYKGLPFIHTLLLNVEIPDAIIWLVYNWSCWKLFPTNVEIPETYRFSNSKSIIFASPNTSNFALGAELPIPTRPPEYPVSA